MAARPVSQPREAASVRDGPTKPHGSANVNTVELNGASAHGDSASEGESSPHAILSRSLATEALTVPKISILRETTTRVFRQVKSQLGSASDDFFVGGRTFDEFLDALETERLRHMPHDGSNWDTVFRWVESFAGCILAFHEAVEGFMEHSEDAMRLILGSTLSLLQMGPTQVPLLTKAFGLFHRLGVSIALFLRQRRLVSATAETRRELAYAFSDLVQLVASVNTHYRLQAHGSDVVSATDFDAHFGGTIADLLRHKDHVSNAMWAFEGEMSRRLEGPTVNVQKIRSFLASQDRTLRKTRSLRQHLGSPRAEFTCQWFAGPLKSFTRSSNKILLATGPPRCGKSVLAGWAVETLQAAVGRASFDVVSHHIDPEVPSESSPLGVIKSLLLQNLDRHIGHVGFLPKIRAAMKMASSGSPSAQVEDALWDALELTLDHDRLIIVIDGLDQIAGGPPAMTTVLDRLHAAASKSHRDHVRALVFSRPLSKAAPALTHHLPLPMDRVRDDVSRFARSRFHAIRPFQQMSDEDRDAIVSKLARTASGSFLHAEILIRCLRRETSIAGINAALERIGGDFEKTLDGHLASLGLGGSDASPILAWVLAAERPLTLGEIQRLLETDAHQVQHSRRFVDIEDEVRRACGWLVRVQQGAVVLRHHSIRAHVARALGQAAGTSGWEEHRAAIHLDLMLRCLAHVKIHVHGEMEPSFKRLPWSDVHAAFDRFDLLEYTARYWTLHFSRSSCHDAHGKHSITATIKKCFPSSVQFALIEATCLQSRRVLRDVATFQRLSRTIRRSALGERSYGYLQSLIMDARLCKKTGHKATIDLVYDAWETSKWICQTTVILQCAELFVTCTSFADFTRRTAVVIRVESVLKYLVETHRHLHGASHDLTIRYLRMLADVLVQIHDAEQAVVLYRELYELSIERYGYFHHESTSIHEILIAQLTVLSRFDAILEITQAYHEYVIKTLVVTDERRVTSTFTLIRILEERGETARAEEILVSFWRSVTTQSTTSVSFTETKIDVTLEYSRFLRRHSRTEEAVTIMRGLWTEFSSFHEERHSTTILTRIKRIAQEFTSLQVTSVSRSIFSSLWSYYKAIGEHTSTEATEVVSSLTETVTESVSSSTTTTTTTETSTLTVEEEHTLREVLETTLSSSSTTTQVSSSIIKTCVALASSYSRQERYSEAVEIYSKTLRRTWSRIETVEATELVVEQSAELIQVALSLAHCRFQMLQIAEAEVIYRNVLRTLLRGATHDHSFVLRIGRSIIEFHEKTYRFEKALDVYQQLIVFCRTSRGKKHETTVELLYAYATLALRLSRRREAEEAYHEIYVVHVLADGSCHRRALTAARKLCELYDAAERWEVSRTVYGCLWQTFLAHHVEYALDTAFFERVYEKYMAVLERARCEVSVLRQLAVEYRTTCVSFYGERHEITIKATMHLAQISERSEEHREESMTLYEQVLKHSETLTRSSTSTATTTTSSVTSTMMHTVKKRLAQMYSAKTTTVSKAVSLYQEEVESCKTQYGFSSTQTITAVQNLVQTYVQQKTQETTRKATSLLRTTTTEIFEKETHSARIIESAHSVARTYVACGFTETAVGVMHDLRRTIVERVRTSQTSIRQSSFAFFAAFAEVLVEGSSFSTIMADLRTEVLLYEGYFRSTKTERDVVGILRHGARLRLFLLDAKRSTEVQTFEEEMFQLFATHLSVRHTVQGSIFGQFFHICLHNVSDDHHGELVIRLAVDAVREHTTHGRFQDAYDLAVLVDRYIQIQEGFRAQRNILVGFQLSLYLAGRRTKSCGDAALSRRMLELSTAVLQAALDGSRHVRMSFTELSVSEVNELVVLLGEQGNLEDLERILAELWSSRTVQKTWSSAVVVSIGRRLVEVRFSRGQTDEAIRLCEDIRYNLTRVWGALDATTLQFTALLSELHASTGSHARAMAVHEDVLSQLVYDDEDLEESHALDVAVHHIELLRRTYQRHGKWNKDEETYRDLLGTLSHRFGEKKLWKERKVSCDFKKWSTKGADNVGVWSPPKNFGLLGNDKKATHQRMLRRTSSNWAVAGHGCGMASKRTIGV